MSDFWYGIVQPLFGDDNVKLLYTGYSYLYHQSSLMFFFNVFVVVADTDSFYIQFDDFSRDEVLLKLSDHLDLSNFPPTHPIFNIFDYDEFATQRRSQFGFLKVDSGPSIIRAHIVEKKKSYSTYLEQYDVTSTTLRKLKRLKKMKGCPSKSAKKLKDSEILGLIRKPGVLKAKFRSLRSNKHIISMIQQEKNVSNSFDNSAMYRSCNLCNAPFHCTLPNIGLCVSVDCKLMQLLVDIWHRLVS